MTGDQGERSGSGGVGIEFLSQAAHELNTPITPIKVQLHLLRTGALEEPAARAHALEVLERNVDRLGVLVQDLLDVARIESGRLKIERKAIDLPPVVHQTLETFRPVASERNVALGADLPPSLVVCADPARVTQVLFNLVSNALKFTPQGGSVRVGARLVEDFALISVRDTGAGIPASEMGKLFLPFSQLPDGGYSSRVGTGLGLYISRGLVEGHGGKVWCESEGAGKGSTFAFTLPRNAGNQAAAP